MAQHHLLPCQHHRVVVPFHPFCQQSIHPSISLSHIIPLVSLPILLYNSIEDDDDHYDHHLRDTELFCEFMRTHLKEESTLSPSQLNPVWLRRSWFIGCSTEHHHFPEERSRSRSSPETRLRIPSVVVLFAQCKGYRKCPRVGSYTLLSSILL